MERNRGDITNANDTSYASASIQLATYLARNLCFMQNYKKVGNAILPTFAETLSIFSTLTLLGKLDSFVNSYNRITILILHCLTFVAVTQRLIISKNNYLALTFLSRLS